MTESSRSPGQQVAIAIVAVAILAAGACAWSADPVSSGGMPPAGGMAPGGPTSGGMAPPPRATPPATGETAVLLARLVTLADSARSEDQAELARRLSEASTLDQLDEPAVRDRSRTTDLRLAVVMDHLRDNAASASTRTLAALARSPVYRQSPQREELLVRALGTARPLPPEIVSFLDDQTRATSVNLHVAVEALFDNGSPEAAALFGRKLADPAIDPVYKLGWFRGPMLRHRREPTVLRAAEEWLARPALSPDLKVGLADALFDYRPEEWYPGRGGRPRPPEESATTRDAAAILGRIGQAVLDGDYPASVKASVRRTLGRLPAR